MSSETPHYDAVLARQFQATRSKQQSKIRRGAEAQVHQCRKRRVEQSDAGYWRLVRRASTHMAEDGMLGF